MTSRAQDVSTSSHDFQPIRPWDNRKRGRCQRCLLPRVAHPLSFWAPARSLNDKGKPVTEWDKPSA